MVGGTHRGPEAGRDATGPVVVGVPRAASPEGSASIRPGIRAVSGTTRGQPCLGTGSAPGGVADVNSPLWVAERPQGSHQSSSQRTT